MAIEDKTELTIDLDSRLAHRLEAVAAQHGVSPDDFCRQAIEDALATAAPAPLSYEEMVAALTSLRPTKPRCLATASSPTLCQCSARCAGTTTSRWRACC